MRMSQYHLKDWDFFGIYSSSFSSSIKPGILKILPFQKMTITTTTTTTSTRLLLKTTPFYYLPTCACTSIHSLPPHHFPILPDSSFRPKDDDLENSSEGLPLVAGSIVALGKFDALHVGHRELAIQASKAGTPFLLSFVGIAEVLGWAPRPPIVAKCDRDRVLSSWSPLCGNIVPKEFMIDFSRVRHLTPRQFVEKLSKELGVHGVVAGENYRFGYKAAGDASELARLCDEYGMKAYIINSVMDQNKDKDNSYPQDNKDIGQVSSTRVRHALGKGDMSYVSQLLGRQHRLILSTDCCKEELDGSKIQFSAPRSSLLNLPPKDGLYDNCSLIVGDEIQLPCRLLIDSTHIHLESDVKDSNILDAIKGVQLLGVEFRG